MPSPRDILRLARPGDWTKNSFVLLAFIFWAANAVRTGETSAIGGKAEALEDLLEDPLERPAEPQASRARGRNGRIRKAMENARLDRFTGHRDLDHAAAGRTEIDRDMPASTAHA